MRGMILASKYARENNIPYLGICLGMQIAVIEFARSVSDFTLNLLTLLCYHFSSYDVSNDFMFLRRQLF